MAFQAALARGMIPEAPQKVVTGDRRERHALVLLARYILSGGREFPCQTKDISAEGAAVYAPVRAAVGEAAVLHAPGAGRLPGRIVRHFPGGFAMTFEISDARADELARRLACLAHRPGSAMDEARLIDDAPPEVATLRLATGEELAAELVSLSISGATVRVGAPLPPGMRLMIGKTAARVIRNRDECAIVEFLTPVRRLWPTGKIDF